MVRRSAHENEPVEAFPDWLNWAAGRGGVRREAGCVLGEGERRMTDDEAEAWLREGPVKVAARCRSARQNETAATSNITLNMSQLKGRHCIQRFS